MGSSLVLYNFSRYSAEIGRPCKSVTPVRRATPVVARAE
jgi:hypothetical protein